MADVANSSKIKQRAKTSAPLPHHRVTLEPYLDTLTPEWMRIVGRLAARMLKPESVVRS
jgi:hypothetical protein